MNHFNININYFDIIEKDENKTKLNYKKFIETLKSFDDSIYKSRQISNYLEINDKILRKKKTLKKKKSSFKPKELETLNNLLTDNKIDLDLIKNIKLVDINYIKEFLKGIILINIPQNKNYIKQKTNIKFKFKQLKNPQPNTNKNKPYTQICSIISESQRKISNNIKSFKLLDFNWKSNYECILKKSNNIKKQIDIKIK